MSEMPTLEGQLDEFAGLDELPGEADDYERPIRQAPDRKSRTNLVINEESYRRSGEIAELWTALAKAQGEFEPVEKPGKNPAFKSSYSTLGAVVTATRDGLARHALCIMQMPVNFGANIGVTTLLGHSSGQWIESTLYVAPQRFDAQGVGSVITYLRRYGRMAILGLAPEDDDANAAVGKPVPTTPTKHVGAFSKNQEPPEPRSAAGPTPEHVKLVLREAQEMKAAGREQALAWFERLEPEDREILTAAKARRKTRELPS